MNRSVSKNYLYNIIYEGLSLLSPLITTPYVSRVIGAEGIGIYSYSYSIVAYFAYFAALGTTVYARRGIAYAQESRKDRSQLFWEILFLRVLNSLICLAVYFAYIIQFEKSGIAVVQSLYIVTVIFDITWLFQGMENFGAVVLRNALTKIAGIAFIFLFVHTSQDLTIYVMGLVAFPLAGNIVMWSGLKNYVGKPDFSDFHPFRHVRGSFALFIPTIASQVYLLLDKTMIGWFTDTNLQNGYYEQAQKVVKICWTLVTTFSTVMSPRIAFVFANGSKDKLREYMRDSFQVVWFLATPIALGLIAITQNLIPWFFGDEFGPVKTLLYIFSIIVVPIGINSVTGSQFLVPTRRQTLYTWSIIAGAAFNFSLNLYLIPRLYAVGAAISSVGAEFLIALIQVLYIVLVLKELSFRDVLGGAYRYWIAGGIMLVVVGGLELVFPPTMVYTLIQIALGILIYFGLLCAVKDRITIKCIERALGILHIKKATGNDDGK